jgi:diacylglycerol kinase family enzyme
VQPLLVVANASAGSHEQEALDAALDVLRAATDVHVVSTDAPDELDDVLCDLEGRGVVVAGGDGSLHAVVNALNRLDVLKETRLGLLPLGTGNDFARGLSLSLEPCEAAQVIVRQHTARINLIVDDSGTVVVNNVHLGVGAQASRQATRWKGRLGRLGYVAGAIAAAVNPRFVQVEVTVDGEPLTPVSRVAQVAIGNGSNVGGGTELIPGADPVTGQLVVIVSRAGGHLSRLVYLARLRAGSHHLMKEVTRVTGCEVHVEGDHFWTTSDGELSGPYRSRTWQLRTGAVEMYLPERRRSAG